MTSHPENPGNPAGPADRALPPATVRPVGSYSKPRTNFSERVKRAARARAGELCEGCAMPHLNKFEFDHVIPDQLGGDAELANCKLLCVACHKEKTKSDAANIAKAKRVEAAHLRVEADKPPIPARKKPSREYTKSGFPPRPLYRSIA